MNRIQSLIAVVQDTLFGDPVNRAYEAVKDAMRDVSRRTAEATYHHMMADFYQGRTKAIDPYQDHVAAQDFANAMKALHDHRLDLQVEDSRIAEAQAKLDACNARLTQLKNGENQ